MITFKGYRIIAKKINAMKFMKADSNVLVGKEWRSHIVVYLDGGHELRIICDEGDYMDLIEAVKETL